MTAPPVKYRTTVAAAKTVGEIHDLLAKHGAAAVATTYADGKPSGLTFQIDTAVGRQTYSLPVRVDAVHALLERAKRTGSTGVDTRREHAERVAWRITKDWLGAQLSLISADLATLDQVMLPYMLVGPEQRTLHDAFRESRLAIDP